MILPPVIGHRGACGVAPENTLASFRRAAALGAAMVEFDVRLSADGHPVVFHDDDLDRTSTGTGPVAAQGLDRIKTLDAGSWFGPDFAGESVPTLDEVLRLCLDLGLGINMEIKPDAGREGETGRVALDHALALWPDNRPLPLISSFAWDCLEVARATAPEWPRGLLVGAIPADWRSHAERYGCKAIHADHRDLDAGRVAEVTSSGLCVLAYTVNDARREEALRGMGVSSVFTDFPHSS
ncbi:glycerophosphodiester phosphodiesterase [Paramagnetospirillum kuznetsovii]|uniref:Glycerophosphodiester phosphodiesterase n=1 Tax=Paramagnetospirillum kuznetsovii TaxID=2053833 RepID=A0A364P1A7_9PROT|nr:glycerophosphodiester phosphodiesterase [Paramagnetospirillum kuznetsovii]RAU23093.1 glycerophosphodiester phosphodiesterase [Paramagnetospirillum kuznetsovii]